LADANCWNVLADLAAVIIVIIVQITSLYTDAWIYYINMWTGLPVEESIGMTEINGASTSMVWPTLGSKTAKEQNRTDAKRCIAMRVSITKN